MTPQKIKELVLENRDLEFSEFIDLLKSIDEENEELYGEVVELAEREEWEELE